MRMQPEKTEDIFIKELKIEYISFPIIISLDQSLSVNQYIIDCDDEINMNRLKYTKLGGTLLIEEEGISANTEGVLTDGANTVSIGTGNRIDKITQSNFIGTKIHNLTQYNGKTFIDGQELEEKPLKNDRVKNSSVYIKLNTLPDKIYINNVAEVFIDNSWSCNHWHDLIISLRNTSKFIWNDASIDLFDIELRNASEITMSGQCDTLNLSLINASNADLEKLTTQNAKIYANNCSNIEIDVVNSADIEATNMTSVVLIKNPKEIKKCKIKNMSSFEINEKK